MSFFMRRLNEWSVGWRCVRIRRLEAALTDGRILRARCDEVTLSDVKTCFRLAAAPSAGGNKKTQFIG
jgi:hypothetical protein